MEDDEICVAVALRLGALICQEHNCQQCGTTVDHFGRHGLSCIESAGRQSRHYALNEIIRRAIVASGTPAVREPRNLVQNDEGRPDGMTGLPWSQGK